MEVETQQTWVHPSFLKDELSKDQVLRYFSDTWHRTLYGTQTWDAPSLNHHYLLGVPAPDPRHWTEGNRFQSAMTQGKRDSFCHCAGMASGDPPTLLGVLDSHEICPQLLKEPDLWQSPMISAVINDAVKLINLSLFTEKKIPLVTIQLFTSPWPISINPNQDPRIPLTDGPNNALPSKLPTPANNPSCSSLSFDSLTGGLTGLLKPNTILHRYEPVNTSMYHSHCLQHLLNYSDEMLDK